MRDSGYEFLYVALGLTFIFLMSPLRGFFLGSCLLFHWASTNAIDFGTSYVSEEKIIIYQSSFITHNHAISFISSILCFLPIPSSSYTWILELTFKIIPNCM